MKITIVVSLRAVVDEMEMLSEPELHAFLNWKTGELYGGTTEQLSMAEEWDDEDIIGWQLEVIQKLREVLGSADWMKLPRRDKHEDYRIMQRFCLDRCAGRLQDELLSAIEGQGAFGRFRETIERRGLKEDWYTFRRECLSEDAAGWLEANGIAYNP